MDLLGLMWQRPWGALALLGPALVWLLALRRGRPQEVWTGTLEVWREVAAAQTSHERRARRLTPPVRLLIGALVAGALALAGPRAPRTDGSRTWTVVVDRSPSMYLSWVAPQGAVVARGNTRIERAVARAQELLCAVRASDDRVVWLSYEDGQPVHIEGDRFPQSWHTPPRVKQSEPSWSWHDGPGALWLSDAEPPTRAHEAGLALSGGDAVPGFVAALGTTRVEWDGQRLLERLDAGRRPVVFLEPGCAGPVERVVRAWAQARGCSVATDRSADVVLELVQAPLEGGAGRTGILLACVRDGWRWRVGLSGGLAEPGEVWLRTDELGLPVVVWEPGRITLASGLGDEEPEGDPADFALSWSALLDRAALAPAGVVSHSERRAVGVERSRAPMLAPAPATRSPILGPEVVLAAMSATLTLLACGLWRR